MSSPRKKSHHPNISRNNIAIQLNPDEFLDDPSFIQPLSNSTKPSTYFEPSPKIKERTNELIHNIQKAQQLSKQKYHNNRTNALQARKNVTLNLMRLQDKNFQLDKNIYNISIGQITSKQAYLSNLQEELDMLRLRIQDLEDEETERIKMRTIGFANRDNQSEQESRISSRRSSLGKIHQRSSNTHSQKKYRRFENKQQQSSYFKWEPKVQNRWMSIEPKKEQSEEQESKKISENTNTNMKTLANYRVKQKPLKHPAIAQKSLTAAQNSRTVGQKSLKKAPFHEIKTIKTGIFVNLDQLKRQRQQQQKRSLQQLKMKPQQQKEIFVRNPQWQIKTINDDFRTKIINKLQIPQNFPIEAPDITQPLEYFQHKSVQIYAIFGIDTSRCSQKVIVRKFKNGIYFQMKPNKNIVWYCNGSFYIGDWETELPSQAEKNGFGFEYVPNKYYYLGQFKNGNRSGNGAMKLIGKNNEFIAYDGEWLNGKPNGFGKHIDEKSNKYIGSFQNGQKSGQAVVLNRDGLIYEGEIKNGLKSGRGIQKLVNGDSYSGYFLEGKFNGHGIYKWKNGSAYEGQFVNGKRQGKGVWKSHNGDQFEGAYLNDMKHGWGRFSWKNGQIYEGEFRSDVRHGEGFYKHPSGKVGKYLWKDGQIEHRIEQQAESHNKTESNNEAQEVELE